MPAAELIAAFETARGRLDEAVEALVPLTIELAVAAVAEVLPGADALETEGEMNEDWGFTLRIRRVLDDDGRPLYDVETAHDDPQVEDRLDEVGSEYLGLLLDLTGDEYLGRKVVARPEP